MENRNPSWLEMSTPPVGRWAHFGIFKVTEHVGGMLKLTDLWVVRARFVNAIML